MFKRIELRYSLSCLILINLLILFSHYSVYPEWKNETNVKGKKVIDLHEGWFFREEGQSKWHKATVPGCVHTDLLNNNLIDDPFYRDNEKKLKWIERRNWEYQTTFSIPDELLQHDVIELIFKGLDTYADVYLNDRRILNADNMFRQWKVSCKDEMKTGSNQLRIHFRSPIQEILPIMKKMEYQLPAGNDQGEKTVPHTRKAQYHFGWDWGPRFVTCGIWQPVYLEFWDKAHITDFHIRQNKINPQIAHLTAYLEINSTENQSIQLTIQDKNKSFEKLDKTIQLKPGINSFSIDIAIDQPNLWWPAGYGDQHLYTIGVALSISGKLMDESSTRIGLRSLELRQKKDKWGKSFEFVINDVPVFAKGGNWIPADNFLNRVTRDRYHHLLKSCKQANMNILRIWGGGIYENETFYDLCDEMGIMVWQDFMFACALYPGDNEFLENVRQEAIDQVKRLRDHPSIVLWCGNNEIEIGWFNWGWKEQLPSKLWQDYEKIFHEILPDVCSRLDPSRNYWPSSPSSDLEADANAQEIGDMHYWGVWHEAKQFEEYENQYPRFMSEYGFQSFPQLKTVNAYTEPEDHHIESDVMMAHQKHPRGNQLINKYLLRRYPEPKDFESFLYVSQVLQAEGIKLGAEHLRRIMPRCMGSLYWQIDDCWPVASWSSIDYFGRWKALHYYAKRFYNDILVSPNEENEEIRIYVVSDRMQSIEAQLIVQLLDFKGSIIKTENQSITINPQSSQVYYKIPKENLFKKKCPQDCFLHCELIFSSNLLSENNFYFEPYKNLTLEHPAINLEYREGDKTIVLKITTDIIARSVYLSNDQYDGHFTDNFFDLIPGKTKQIEYQFDKPISLGDFKQNLKIISLINAF